LLNRDDGAHYNTKAKKITAASITPKAFANFSPGFEHRENPGRNSQFATNPAESVGKIKIRKKQGMKNHSSSSKNSLQGKYAQEIF